MTAADTQASATFGKVTVTPAEFTLVRYEADEIAAFVSELAEQLGVANPIHLVVNEKTPLAKVSAEVASASSDETVVINAESGAIENTKQLQTFGPKQATVSLGRMLLRARDRMRDDFADAPPDLDLSLQQNAAWDAYCAGRLARQGYDVNQQRFRYNYRNRFGFSDAADAAFERIWSADDLGWADLTATP